MLGVALTMAVQFQLTMIVKTDMQVVLEGAVSLVRIEVLYYHDSPIRPEIPGMKSCFGIRRYICRCNAHHLPLGQAPHSHNFEFGDNYLDLIPAML